MKFQAVKKLKRKSSKNLRMTAFVKWNNTLRIHCRLSTILKPDIKVYE